MQSSAVGLDKGPWANAKGRPGRRRPFIGNGKRPGLLRVDRSFFGLLKVAISDLCLRFVAGLHLARRLTGTACWGLCITRSRLNETCACTSVCFGLSAARPLTFGRSTGLARTTCLGGRRRSSTDRFGLGHFAGFLLGSSVLGCSGCHEGNNSKQSDQDAHVYLSVRLVCQM